MRILQIVTYLAFIIGAAGIEDQEHNMQPAAMILMFAAAAALLIMAKKKKGEEKDEVCSGGKSFWKWQDRVKSASSR